MRIGFTSIYSFRPHVELMVYLASLLRDAGHETFFLTCDSAVPDCYARWLKGGRHLMECAKCIAGGVRSYPVGPVTRMRGALRGNLDQETLEHLVVSSAHTLNRTETPEDFTRPPFLATRDRLVDAADIAFGNARRWIKANRLEGVILFNGRMDMTRAILHACRELGVPFITYERTWFGDGVQLIPNANCLSLTELDRLNRAFRNQPLTERQARIAARLGSERFLARNMREWRLYNVERVPVAWPVAGSGRRALILPSSSNEFRAHPERVGDWPDYTQGFDQVLDRLGLDAHACVIRCHPNWGEYIGRVPGEHIERYYLDWARRRRMHAIPSADKASTQDLMAQADLVLLNGSSAAVEAGLHGKKIVCLGHSSYQEAGLAVQIRADAGWDALETLKSHDPECTIRRTLRFLYMMAKRFPQFTRHIRAHTTTRYEYLAGADAERILEVLRTGHLRPDDPETAPDDSGESKVVRQVIAQDWEALAAEPAEDRPGARVLVQRRFGLRWIDSLREHFPVGDRMMMRRRA